MARPTTTDERAERMREQRRAEILSVAKKLFAEQGYHATSVSDIIRAAGVARGTFYLYFASKHKIFESVLEQALTDLRGCIEPVDLEPGASPPARQLRDNLLRILSFVVGEPELVQLVLNPMSSDKEIIERIQAFEAEATDLIATALGHGVELGLARECDVTLVAAAIYGALRGAIQHVVRQTDLPDLGHVVDELLAYAARGVAVPGIWAQSAKTDG